MQRVDSCFAFDPLYRHPVVQLEAKPLRGAQIGGANLERVGVAVLGAVRRRQHALREQRQRRARRRAVHDRGAYADSLLQLPLATQMGYLLVGLRHHEAARPPQLQIRAQLCLERLPEPRSGALQRQETREVARHVLSRA